MACLVPCRICGTLINITREHSDVHLECIKVRLHEFQFSEELKLDGRVDADESSLTEAEDN